MDGLIRRAVSFIIGFHSGCFVESQNCRPGTQSVLTEDVKVDTRENPLVISGFRRSFKIIPE